MQALVAFQPYLRGAPLGLPFDWSAAAVRRGLNFTLTTTIGDVDVLGEIAGSGFYDALVEHTIVVYLFGHQCRCLDLPNAELEALHEETEVELQYLDRGACGHGNKRSRSS